MVRLTESDGIEKQPGGSRGRPNRKPHVPTVVEAVTDDLRSRILNGEFAPGTQLRENDLLEDYGIARHGIRSALHALAHDGLLRHEAHKGVFVPDSDPAEIEDIMSLRHLLESRAIEYVVDNDPSTSGIQAALDRLDAVAEDAPWSELLAADLAVHQAIVDAVGSPRMSRVQAALIAESALFLAFHQAKDRESATIRPFHRKLVKSVIGGKQEEAQEMLREDLEQGLAVLRSTASPAGQT